MAGGDPEALSFPFGFICIIHRAARTISIYQLLSLKMKGLVCECFCAIVSFSVSPTQSLLPSVVPVKMGRA